MNPTERARLLAQWLVLGALSGALAGVASAVFLVSLDAVTQLRESHRVITFALPLAGLCLGWFYQHYGAPIQGGTNLVITTIQEGGPQLPLRMAPMVLAGTVLTHLLGGSAGREGTAVQMGASLSDALAGTFRVGPALRRQVLVAGVAGGFGSVFGTPMAGAVFALEFVVRRRMELTAFLPATLAALVGDLTTRALGVTHTPYPTLIPHALTALLAAKWLVFAAAVALTTSVFVELTGETPSGPAFAHDGWRSSAGGDVAGRRHKRVPGPGCPHHPPRFPRREPSALGVCGQAAFHLGHAGFRVSGW